MGGGWGVSWYLVGLLPVEDTPTCFCGRWLGGEKGLGLSIRHDNQAQDMLGEAERGIGGNRCVSSVKSMCSQRSHGSRAVVLERKCTL